MSIHDRISEPKYLPDGSQSGSLKTVAWKRTESFGLFRRQLPQHVLQNAAVLKVLDLLRRIDPDLGRELLHSPIGSGSLHRERPPTGKLRPQQSRQPREVVDLFARQPQRLHILPILKLQWQNP